MLKRILHVFVLVITTIGIAHGDTANITWLNDDKTTYDTTTCTVGGDIILPTTPTKRGYDFMGWVPIRYTEIEYLESTGTQYIDTGFKPNQDTRVVMEYTMSSTCNRDDVNCSLFGGRTSKDVDQVAEIFVKGIWRSYYGANDINGGQGSYFFENKLKIDADKNIITITSAADPTNIIATHSFNAQTFQSSYPMHVFSFNNGDAGASSLGHGKIYSFKIYDNGTLVRDMIPVLDENDVPCMFDRVSYSFFYNAGTGSFTAGPVISNQ